MKLPAILFTLFIILVIILADAGILNRYIGSIYKFPFGDKAGHFILYGVLVLLLNLALFRSYPNQNRNWLVIKCGLVLTLLIGLEEFSQKYFSSRTFDIVDLSFSYLGILFFSGVSILIK